MRAAGVQPEVHSTSCCRNGVLIEARIDGEWLPQRPHLDTVVLDTDAMVLEMVRARPLPLPREDGNHFTAVRVARRSSSSRRPTAASHPLAGLVAWEAITSPAKARPRTALLPRAGIVNVSLSHFIDATGERVMLCHSPALPATLSGADRLVAPAAHALLRLLPQLPPGSGALLTILLALPERLAARWTTASTSCRPDRPCATGCAVRCLSNWPTPRSSVSFGAPRAPALRRASTCCRAARVWSGGCRQPARLGRCSRPSNRPTGC